MSISKVLSHPICCSSSQLPMALPSDDAAFASPETLSQRYSAFVSLDDFLHYYYIGMSVLQTEYDFELLIRRYLDRAAKDGVVHAEIFFDPQAHLSRGIALQTLLSAFEKARTYASVELDVSTELICCFLRHLPVSDCVSTYELADLQSALASGVVRGIGLDSSEIGFPPELFESLYQDAALKGYQRTAHAGEEGPPSNIATSLDRLQVQRVDHGVRLVQDPALMVKVATQGTLLTICPLSNVFLKVVTSVAELPIRQFIEAGVHFSINSDDPAYFADNFVLANYVAVQDAFNLTVGEWETICLNSINGSWCTEHRKVEMRGLLKKVMEDWQV